MTGEDPIRVLSRNRWGARSDLPRLGHNIGPARSTEVFIHHTVVIDTDETTNEWESLAEVRARMRQLQTIRAKDLGADVPYSMVAFCMANGDLVLCEGRGIYRTGAHSVGHNRSALGIAFQGNFEFPPLPTHFEDQLAALGARLNRLGVAPSLIEAELAAMTPAGRGGTLPGQCVRHSQRMITNYSHA